MTQACGLACRHCRAEAVSTPHPNELTFGEGKRLLHQIAAFNHPTPHLVFTGGDPLRRKDLFALIDEARSLGINASITPSATSDLTVDILAKLKEHGIDSFGLSLDGSDAARHEAVRGVEGCFDLTIAGARAAASLAYRSKSTRSSPRRPWTKLRQSMNYSRHFLSCAGASSSSLRLAGQGAAVDLQRARRTVAELDLRSIEP
jgi:MoaA/NifB/PqqE/SkfB family radical SAM enzyme